MPSRSPFSNAFRTTLKNPLVIIVVLYSLAHCLLLVNTGKYGEDWFLFNSDPHYITDDFTSAFRYAGGAITAAHYLVNVFPDKPFIYHTLVFLLYLCGALFFYGILGPLGKIINNSDRLYLTLFFALFPFNSARITSICFTYTVLNWSFYAGFYLLARYCKKPDTLLRLGSLVFFFYSFFALSTVALYVAVMAYIIYLKVYKKDRLKAIVRYVDFMLLPVFFWILRVLFFSGKSGVLASYYSVHFGGVVKAPVLVLIAFLTSFVNAIDLPFKSISVMLVVIAVLFSIVLNRVRRREKDHLEEIGNDPKLFFTGILLFAAGAAPYCVAGFVPTMFGWMSRHQLLLPAGASFMLLYGLKLLFKGVGLAQNFRTFILSLCIVMFIGYTIQTYIAYQREAFKQESMVAAMKDCWCLKNHTTILFDDQASELNAVRRTFTYEEFAGMMKQAFGDESRFGACSREDFVEFHSKEYFSTRHMMKDYTYSEPDIKVIIRSGNHSFNEFDVVKLLVDSVINKKRYVEQIRRLIKIECTPLEW